MSSLLLNIFIRELRQPKHLIFIIIKSNNTQKQIRAGQPSVQHLHKNQKQQHKQLLVQDPTPLTQLMTVVFSHGLLHSNSRLINLHRIRQGLGNAFLLQALPNPYHQFGTLFIKTEVPKCFISIKPAIESHQANIYIPKVFTPKISLVTKFSLQHLKGF